jgi:hypothetical protein
MQAPHGYEGRFCKITYPDAPGQARERCCFVLKKGKNKGALCDKAGALRGTLPTCTGHLHVYNNAESMYQATYYFADDGSGEMFAVVDAFPRPAAPPIPTTPVGTPVEAMAFFPAPTLAPATGGPPLVRTVNIGAIPVAIERTKECSVCELEEHPLILPCDHTVCVECMKRLTSQLCPMCRTPFEMTQLKRLA